MIPHGHEEAPRFAAVVEIRLVRVFGCSAIMPLAFWSVMQNHRWGHEAVRGGRLTSWTQHRAASTSKRRNVGQQSRYCGLIVEDAEGIGIDWVILAIQCP